MSAEQVRVLAAAVCQVDEDLLLVRHGRGPAGGEWRLPQVAVRPGEAVGEAVVRACVDLAGCDTLCGPFLGWDEHPEAASPTVELYFQVVLADAAHATPSAPTGAAPDETGAAPVEARFVPLWEVPELRVDQRLAEFLSDHDIIDTVV